MRHGSVAVNFLIIGAQKAGTTACSYNIGLHPDVEMFSGENEFGQREIEFFNQHWSLGVAWYATHFKNIGKLKGEKTAELLHRYVCHERMWKLFPHAKLIVLLRCPVRRAHSQWRMASRPGWGETRPFEEVIDTELREIRKEAFVSDYYRCRPSIRSNWREGFVLKGLYEQNLKNLFRYYPREQVHIAFSEQVLEGMGVEYRKMFDFLELEQKNLNFKKKFVGTISSLIEPNISKRLTDFYRPENERLFELIGSRCLSWL